MTSLIFSSVTRGTAQAAIHVNLAGAAAIAAALPPLHAVAATLPPYQWPAVALQRFDLDRTSGGPRQRWTRPAHTSS